jgi:hypothetical protein
MSYLAIFFVVFLAVFVALRASKNIDEYSYGRRLHKRYCKAQVAHYNYLMNLHSDAGDDRGANQYAEQYRYWTKRCESWTGWMDEDHYTESMVASGLTYPPKNE